MRFKHLVLLGTLATTVSTPEAGTAATESTIYVANNPSQYVKCLVLNEVADQVTGYFEIDQRSDDSATGETRIRVVFSRKFVGTILTFGEYSAMRTASGYTLTSMSKDGRVSQQRLTRSTASAVNAALGTLAMSVRRSRALNDLRAADAELIGHGVPEKSPTSKLAAAEARLDRDVVTERALQVKADSLWQVANDRRAVADAEMDSPGVSLEQNDSLKAAMEIADQAERKARFAQRLATLAVANVRVDDGDVAAARDRLATLQQRVEASAATLKLTGDLADR